MEGAVGSHTAGSCLTDGRYLSSRHLSTGCGKAREGTRGPRDKWRVRISPGRMGVWEGETLHPLQPSLQLPRCGHQAHSQLCQSLGQAEGKLKQERLRLCSLVRVGHLCSFFFMFPFPVSLASGPCGRWKWSSEGGLEGDLPGPTAQPQCLKAGAEYSCSLGPVTSEIPGLFPSLLRDKSLANISQKRHKNGSGQIALF